MTDFTAVVSVSGKTLSLLRMCCCLRAGMELAATNLSAILLKNGAACIPNMLAGMAAVMRPLHTAAAYIVS